ncbi:DsbA family protein [Phreatobacter stygius]|uniref:Disulfide bond formation protein DsbA n=1 Tax=Phreatobacter stygius TaxID=1940610 RepID=A0A4D7B547_9HYPH|nr:DsbA family protein [Phreatobacter stygius]QCI65568.1 disulfide bond formation protein DsbA [Phreatobacter stygius]
MILTRRRLIATGAVAAMAPMAVPASGADDAWFPLRGPDGREVSNFRVPVELETEIAELDNGFSIGSESPDITLTEIYDSNCGYCRRAANDVKAMAEADPDLRIRFVNAPSLGLPSFQAARVEYAVKLVGGEAKARAFFDISMAARGVFDGLRALEAAKDIGLDDNEIETVADKPETGQVLAQAVRLANATNLAATPSWLIAGVALIGWPGRGTIEAAVRAVRECDKPVCS